MPPALRCRRRRDSLLRLADGWLYFAQGSATNAGVVGRDNDWRARNSRPLAAIAGENGISHIPLMVMLLSILLGLSLTVVVAVLLTGVIAFAKGGAFHERHATTLMNMRVAAQFVAVVIFALLVHILG